jgi:hypothetical protein
VHCLLPQHPQELLPHLCCCCCCFFFFCVLFVLQDLQESLSLLGSMPHDALVAPAETSFVCSFAVCATASARLAASSVLMCWCCCCCCFCVMFVLQDLQEWLSLLGSMPPDALVAVELLWTQVLCCCCVSSCSQLTP